MKNVFVGNPYAKVEFATEVGQIEILQKQIINTKDMDFDIISIETSRDMADDTPTFTINLIYREEWYRSIGSNDFVQIELGRGSKAGKVMFGLIDNVYKSWSFIDLKPVRSISISGRGFNKAIMQFGIGAVQEVDFVFTVAGFYETQGYLTAFSPPVLIKLVLENYLNKGINYRFANGKRLTDYMDTLYMEDKTIDLTLGNPLGYYSYQGGLWDYIKELRNAPFYEVFWEIHNDKPTFIVRPTPFNPENWNNLMSTTIDDKDIMDTNLGRTDMETYTVFALKSESLTSNLENVYGLPIWYEPYYEKYGLRRLQINSKYHKTEELPNDNKRVYGDASIEGMGSGMIYPVDPKHKITSKFGKRKKVTVNDTGDHKGIDIGAPRGTPIYAVDDGKVIKVDFNKFRGHYIDIEHSTMVSRYQHCNIRPNAPIGSKVQKGQVIAQVGSSGDSTGNHLHLEILINGTPVDPEKYISVSQSKSNTNTTTSNKEVVTKQQYDKNYVDKAKTEVFKISPTEIEKKTNDILTNDKIGSIANGIDPNRLKDNMLNVINEDKKVVETEELIEKANSYESTIDVSQKTIDIFNWNIKNNIMENGSFTLKGNHVYRIGTRLVYEDMEYYIEKVAHSFVMDEGWITNLQVTRGLKVGTRFTSPWNEWKIITPEDLRKVTGFTPSEESIALANQNNSSSSSVSNSVPIDGLRGKIESLALSKKGMPYSVELRMSDKYADCSSFVYKVSMEALGKSWKGTHAPSTLTNKMRSDIWYEIPLSQVQPWDILHRNGHAEFLGNDGRTFGAHSRSQPAGPGGKYNPNNWERAYRLKGL